MTGKIYTKKGDTGETSLLGGVKVFKDDPHVNVYGTVDEATSAMGMARAATTNDDICRDILALQTELINVMAELAYRPDPTGKSGYVPAPVEPAQVERLEQMIDSYVAQRIETRGFVKPGGSLASAALDLARTIVRRAERHLVALAREESINPMLVKYLNRLSDLLYVMARIDEQREIEKIVTRSLQAANTTKEPAPMALALADSSRMVEAGIRRAHAIGVPMVLAVVDPSGNTIESRRMDGSLVISLTLAVHKAFTAVAVKMPTQQLAELSQPGAPLYGIDINIPNITLVGGGLPVNRNGQIIGGVGASGGSVEQDIDVATAMLGAL